MGAWRNAIAALGGVLALAAATAPSAWAEDSVAVTPTGAGALSSGGTYFRTADAQPTFSIQAPEGVSATCTVSPWDGVGTASPCGPPLPGCAAPFCASFRPGAPVGGAYQLTVQVYDSFGTELGIGGLVFAVDTTAPNTSAQFASEVGDLRPTFQVSAIDDDPLNANVDSLQCSLEQLGAPPSWYPCAPALDGTLQAPHAVPRRHIDWQMQARAVDDLGRVDPTPASAYFDPVPCLVKARGVSIARLISSGVPIKLTCSYFRHVAVDMYSLGANGHRVSVKYALSHRIPLGFQAVTGHQARFTVSKRLRLYKHYDRYYRSYRFAYIVVHVFDPEDLAPVAGTSVIRVSR
ncbi:MAG TPA: hypothetical protein VGL51_00095 [Solirubrobacteraceae bacterium]|jgi:hypothetical protein